MKKRIIAYLAAALMTLACVGCNKAKTPEWTDTVPRPEITAPNVNGSYVTYPEAPENAPADADTNKAPTVKGYASYGEYEINADGEFPVITYDNLNDWDYVYAAVDNYHAEYGNIIITVNSQTAEKITVQAIYYEMYTDNNRAVTVYSGDLGGQTDRRIIARLDKFTKLNGEWQTMGSGNLLENAKIIGFAIFVDSIPVQVVSDRKGSVTIKSFEFVKDDNPGLDMQYIVPSVNFDGSATNEGSGYNLESVKNDSENPELVTGLKVSYDGVKQYSQVYIPIMDKDSVPDYAEFSIKLNTTGVKGYSIGVMFSTGGNNWQNYVSMVTVTNAADGEHEHTVNFDGTSPISMGDWSSVPGEFIKNYGVYQICIWFDSLDGMDNNNSGEAVVSDIVFNRTATDGATIGRAWSTTISSNISYDNIELGGKGTVTYSWYSSWYYLSMPVSGYTPDAPKSKMIVKFTAEEIDRMGIALVASNVKQNNGEAVLCSTWETFGVTESGASGTDSAAYGTTYKVEKDGNDWTITFDFSKAKKQSDGNAFWEATLTALRIYLNDPSGASSGFAGTRTIEFTSIVFED